MHTQTVVPKLAFKWMGVAATPKYKEDAYWTYKERKKLGGKEEARRKGRSSYQNFLITVPSTLNIMLPKYIIVS